MTLRTIVIAHICLCVCVSG